MSSVVSVTKGYRSMSVHDASRLIKIIKLLVGDSSRLEGRYVGVLLVVSEH